MLIPDNVPLYEHPIATLWMIDGIMYSNSKPGARTIAIMEDYISFIKKITGNKKVFILTDMSAATPMDKETRAYSAIHLPELYSAMAIVSETPLGQLIGNIFIQLESQPYPLKIFTDQQEALTWLQQQVKSR